MKKSFSCVLRELYLLMKNGGFCAYHYLGRSLSVDEQRDIYHGIDADFSIKWDLYYLELTLAVSPYPRIARFYLLVYGNISFIAYIIKNRNWVYKAIYPTEGNIFEVYFRDCDNERSDLRPILGFPECTVVRREHNDWGNMFCHLLPSSSHRRLFAKRVDFFEKKYRFARFPRRVILFEGRSLEYRSLYTFARKNEITVEFSWSSPRALLYDSGSFQENANLDYPGVLHAKSPLENDIVQLSESLRFDNDALVVVPTFNSTSEILEWICKTTNLIKCRKFFFAVHPTYPHLKPELIKYGFDSIDDLKVEYMQKYDVFIGSYSTLMMQALEQGKCVIAIGYDQEQVSRMNESLSGITIYDASVISAAIPMLVENASYKNETNV